MALYYYTKTPEDPAVSHNNGEFPEALKMKKKDRVNTDTRPVNRRLCYVC